MTNKPPPPPPPPPPQKCERERSKVNSATSTKSESETKSLNSDPTADGASRDPSLDSPSHTTSTAPLPRK